MTVPVITGAGGLIGWNLLKRTGDVQRQMVARDPSVARASAYFRENIGTVKSADDLVKDYRLLSVALGAFGLEADMPNKAFISKVLEADRGDGKSLINRLTDKRYARLTEFFRMDSGTATIHADGFGDKIVKMFEEREFERRVGEGDANLRLALNARRELAVMAERTSSETTLWYEVMGNPPLRKVFEGAFGFDSSYGRLPVDRQLQEFMKRANSVLGTTSFKSFAEPDGADKLIRTFLARAQLTEGSAVQNRYSAALTLLSR